MAEPKRTAVTLMVRATVECLWRQRYVPVYPEDFTLNLNLNSDIGSCSSRMLLLHVLLHRASVAVARM